jgi:dipeptidyl aminopeptidase/acylaminoacyl peptidase
VNARNAQEFVLARLPKVDPARIFAAGHSSSAGTLSLLFAEHEHRLKAAVSYAPAADVEARINRWRTPDTDLVFPDLDEFLKRSSPRTHMVHLSAPLSLFHATDDDNVPIAHSCRGSETSEPRKRSQGSSVGATLDGTGAMPDPEV